MALLHNLGFPRIGCNRELKFALERFWSGVINAEDLQSTAADLRATHWQFQSGLDLVPVGDFSLYDQVLDMSFTLGHLPERIAGLEGSDLDNYFRMALGCSANESSLTCVHAGEMTKWFDTNYHYIVPEATDQTLFTLNPERLLSQLLEAQQQSVNAKPVIIGPVTYLWLCKEKDQSQRIKLLDQLLPVYSLLLAKLVDAGAEWIQIDEPALVMDLDPQWQEAYERTYTALAQSPAKLLLTTYFGELRGNLELAVKLPSAGLHIDAVRGHEEVAQIISMLPDDKVLSLGVIDGRNIWKSDLIALLDWLEPIASDLENRLWLAPSCSLLHVPVDLDLEDDLDPEVSNWMAFAKQKLDELSLLGAAINGNRNRVNDALIENRAAIQCRKNSTRVHSPDVKAAVACITLALGNRQSSFATREKKQSSCLNLPAYPTTTIGSFPQTAEIRQTRLEYKKGLLAEDQYIAMMKSEIKHAVHIQEELGIDLLVHGEAERNDMVEYFAQHLDGYLFS